MQNRIIFTKYSNDRAERFCIRTQLVEREDKRRFLMKSAENEKGIAHIKHIVTAGETLALLYEESRFLMNRCFLDEDQVILEYLDGHTLEEELDKLLDQKRIEDVLDKMAEVAEEIRKVKNQNEFRLTPEFKEVFGKVRLPDGLLAADAANIDMIFSNVLINENWNVIDYEWTFLFPIPTNFIVFRAIHYYIESAAMRWAIKYKNPYERLGITLEEQKAYEIMEQNFQKYINGDHISLGSLYHTMGEAAISITDMVELIDEKKIQIYYNRGDGFREEDSSFIDVAMDGEVFSAIKIPDNVIELRLDPAMSSCLLEELRVAWDKDFIESAEFETNGFKVEEHIYLFQTSDPMLCITEEIKNRKVLYISYRINLMKQTTAQYLIQRLGKGQAAENFSRKGLLNFIKGK